MDHQNLGLRQIQKHSLQFTNCKTYKQVAQLIRYSPKEITLQAFSPLYYHFTVPKKDGSSRFIESPEAQLKKLQRKLNSYLQCVYYTKQSQVSYGFIMYAKGSKTKKNIYTNALNHLGCNYLLNADFKDFFHQITIAHVTNIFKSKLFNFDTYTAHTLAKICCYKDRLPMGAPTSPVLSNLYTIQLDANLYNWSQKNNFTFTRYVDDLTFSSKTHPVTLQHFAQIKEQCSLFHLKFNPEKTKILGKNDQKTVTGLLLNKTIDIDTTYYQELDKDMERLKHVVEVQHIMGETQKTVFLKRYKQEIMGKINFIATIEGKQSPQYLDYINLFYNALEPSEGLVARWTKFSNYS